jgi:ABC-type transporter MlaC component
VLKGQVEDMSFNGISASFSEYPQNSLGDTLLELPGVTLKVSPVGMVRKQRETLVHFQVGRIESGEERWRHLHYASERAA